MSVWACLTERIISHWEARAWLGFVEGEYVMRSTLRVSMFMYADLAAAIWSASIGVATELQRFADRGRERMITTAPRGCQKSLFVVTYP